MRRRLPPFRLRPRVALGAVVAGSDVDGLLLAADMLPTSSNEEVPDYVLASRDTRWKGAGGWLAFGFWGNQLEYRGDVSYPSGIATAELQQQQPAEEGLGVGVAVLFIAVAAVASALLGVWVGNGMAAVGARRREEGGRAFRYEGMG